MADFSVSVSQWVTKAKAKGDVALRMIAADAVARVKELTPVRSGYLRANWQASFDDEVLPIDGDRGDTFNATEVAGSVAGAMVGQAIGQAIGSAVAPGVGTVIGGATGSIAGGVIGGATASSARREGNPLTEAKVGDKIFIMNPVKYARRIEYGFSGRDARGVMQDQKGRGMVQKTVSELPAIAAKAVDRLARS